MSRLSRPSFGMFRLSRPNNKSARLFLNQFTYVSTLSTTLWHVSTFSTASTNIFWKFIWSVLLRYVSTFSTNKKIQYFFEKPEQQGSLYQEEALKLSGGSPRRGSPPSRKLIRRKTLKDSQLKIASELWITSKKKQEKKTFKNSPLWKHSATQVCSLCFGFSIQNGYVLTVLDLYFDCLDQNQLCFDCIRPIFWLSGPMFRLSRPKLGMFRLCVRLKIAFRLLNFSRKTALARLSKSKRKSSDSTQVHSRRLEEKTGNKN